MKTIGLIGGSTWVSTKEYYRIINQETNKRLGKKHSAKCILYSIDFEEVMVRNWENFSEVAKSFIKISKILEKAGADFIVICANTPHKIADEIEESVDIPLLHIADAVAEKITRENLEKVGLLGTSYTMNEGFIKKRIRDKYGIEVIVPSSSDQKTLEEIIENELTFEIIKDSSREKYKKIIEKLKADGAQGIILGCTEIPLLIREDDVDIPVFDTTSIHAKAAVEFALKN